MVQSSNVPLILSQVVALLTVIASIASVFIQARHARRLKIADLYFNAQLKAYSALLEALVSGTLLTEIGRTAALKAALAAVQPALLLSSPDAASAIRKFYFSHCDYIDEFAEGERTVKAVEDHRDQLWVLQDCLRDEMYRFETLTNRRKFTANGRYRQSKHKVEQ